MTVNINRSRAAKRAWLKRSYNETRKELETLLQKRHIPVGGAFKIEGLTYYRDFIDRGDGVWTTQGMRWVINRLKARNRTSTL